MKLLMVSLILVGLAVFGGKQATAGDDGALFAADAIKPSEMTLALIDRLFRGRMKPVPPDHQLRLDRALIDGDWQSLEDGLIVLENEAGIEAALNWQATRHLAGYLAMSLRYALYSFAVGDAHDENKLKEFSVIAWFYILAAITTDGYKCADWEAPRAFLDDVQSRIADIRAFAASLPAERLQQFQQLALYLEEGTAPDRASDPLLCTYGTSPTKAALSDRKNATLEESATDGSNDAWRDEAAETRTRLPETMQEILAVLKG